MRIRERLGATVAIALLAGVFALGGFMTHRDQRSGTPATATITGCTDRLAKYGGDVCRGRWTIGDPVFGDGRFVEGTVEGATSADEGERIEVRVNGDRATVPGMRLPIILWSMAALVLVLGAYTLLRGPGGRRQPAPPATRVTP